jgi:hypothetical protein
MMIEAEMFDHVAMHAELAKVALAIAIVIALCAVASVIQEAAPALRGYVGKQRTDGC